MCHCDAAGRMRNWWGSVRAMSASTCACRCRGSQVSADAASGWEHRPDALQETAPRCSPSSLRRTGSLGPCHTCPLARCSRGPLRSARAGRESSRWMPVAVCAPRHEPPQLRTEDAGHPLHLMPSKPALLAAAMTFDGADGGVDRSHRRPARRPRTRPSRRRPERQVRDLPSARTQADLPPRERTRGSTSNAY